MRGSPVSVRTAPSIRRSSSGSATAALPSASARVRRATNVVARWAVTSPTGFPRAAASTVSVVSAGHGPHTASTAGANGYTPSTIRRQCGYSTLPTGPAFSTGFITRSLAAAMVRVAPFTVASTVARSDGDL